MRMYWLGLVGMACFGQIQTGQLKIFVRSWEQVPLEGAVVELLDELGKEVLETSFTDMDGQVLFDNQPEGDYVIMVSKKGFVRIERRGILIKAGEVDLEKFCMLSPFPLPGRDEEILGATIVQFTPPGAVKSDKAGTLCVHDYEPVVFTKMVRAIPPKDTPEEEIPDSVSVSAVFGQHRSIFDVKLKPADQDVSEKMAELAMATIKKWEYLPGNYGPGPVDVRMTCDVFFKK